MTVLEKEFDAFFFDAFFKKCLTKFFLRGGGLKTFFESQEKRVVFFKK